MKWSYFFKLWIVTVTLGTLLLMIFLTSETTPFYYWRSIEFYLIILLPITALSFPTFTILAFVFNYLDGFEINVMKVKIILISIIVFGIITTQLIIVKEMSFLFSVNF